MLTPNSGLIVCVTLAALALGLAVYHHVSTPSRPNLLRKLAGPPLRTLFGNHMRFVLEYVLHFTVFYLAFITVP